MIADAIKQASELHRNVLEQTYKGRCTVWERRPYIDPITKLTDPKQEVIVLEDQPCKLSFASSPPASGMPAASAAQSIKLFLASDIEIKAGSKIIVTQENRTATYASSGQPAVYASHQEIELVLWKEWT